MNRHFYRILPFNQKLFLSVLLIFLVFSASFIGFQYQREKIYKSGLLNIQLQNYNKQLYDFIQTNPAEDSLRNYVKAHLIPNLRITLITVSGEVLFDNSGRDWLQFKNHASREEVREALIYESGYSTSRHSESIDG